MESQVRGLIVVHSRGLGPSLLFRAVHPEENGSGPSVPEGLPGTGNTGANADEQAGLPDFIPPGNQAREEDGPPTSQSTETRSRPQDPGDREETRGLPVLTRTRRGSGRPGDCRARSHPRSDSGPFRQRTTAGSGPRCRSRKHPASRRRKCRGDFSEPFQTACASQKRFQELLHQLTVSAVRDQTPDAREGIISFIILAGGRLFGEMLPSIQRGIVFHSGALVGYPGGLI